MGIEQLVSSSLMGLWTARSVYRAMDGVDVGKLDCVDNMNIRDIMLRVGIGFAFLVIAFSILIFR